MGPMYFVAYKIGLGLLDVEPQPFDFELSLSWFSEKFVTIWQPMTLGCVLLGSIAALVGYIGLDLLWRASLADYIAARRARRK